MESVVPMANALAFRAGPLRQTVLNVLCVRLASPLLRMIAVKVSTLVA